MIQRYRKKPVVIEALEWNGSNVKELRQWSGRHWDVHTGIAGRFLCIDTLEGDHMAAVGDYIIKGVAGEFYPCKPEIFEQTYELESA